MNFANVTDWRIPEGDVTKVVDSQNRIIWQKPVTSYNYFYVQNTTNSAQTVSIRKYRQSYPADSRSADSHAPTINVYKSNDKENWTLLGFTSATALTFSLPVNSKVYLKAEADSWGAYVTSYGYCYNNITGCSKVGGNILSLLYSDNFINYNTFPASSNYTFMYLFSGNTLLKDVSDLSLTPRTLKNACYQSMFNGCTYLTSAPTLPATTIASNCYNSMFYNCSRLVNPPTLPAQEMKTSCYASMFDGCTSLVTPPSLPAFTLAQSCYLGMFLGCSSLTSAPALNATTLQQGCYAQMFQNCTSLTTAPDLRASRLPRNCYGYMFAGCTKLNKILCLATILEDTSSQSPTYQWVERVAATGTFTKSRYSSIWTTGVSGIPYGWTVVSQ